jgi:zinc protease
MTFFRRHFLVGAFLLTFSWLANAALNLEDRMPLNPQVKVGKLPNGLIYYIQKNGKPEHRVELRLVVKAGSILEDADQQGLAHFIEHMAFDGSRHFKKHELISYLQSIGVKFGADLSAYTSFDETVYILPIPSDKKENLETGYQVLEDWAQGVAMQDDAIDQERAVVLEEARLGKGANDRMMRALLPAVFNGSKYAERLAIGKEEILKDFPHEVIRRFYADWYRPDLMAVIVVGDIDPEQAEKSIRAHFGHLRNPAHERPRDYAVISPRTESAGLVITDSEATNDMVRIMYPVRQAKPSVTISNYREQMIRNLYAAMLGQRLQELTQQADPPFLGASSAVEPLARGYEAFASTAVLARGGVDPAIAAVVRENERARQLGFSADELERARKTMLRGYERMYNEREKTDSANFAGEYLRNFLVQEEIPGIANEYAYATQLLPGISLDDVNRYAQQNIPGDARKLVVYLGSSKSSQPIPSQGQLLEMVDAAQKVEVVARDEKKLASSLMAQPPKAGSIISEKRNEELGITELILSNGAKVVLKPTDFKNDEVLLSATRFGGQSLYGDLDMYTARYANAVESAMGVDDYTPTDLRKVLAGKSAFVRTGSALYTDDISGSAGSADIESMLQLLYLRMSSPRKDDALFKAFVSKGQDGAKNALSRPESIFSDAVQATLFNNHLRVQRVAKPEDFAKIDLERAIKLYAARFGSAKGLTFIVVGSFDTEKIKPLIATYLASLPSGEVVDNYRDLGIRPALGVVKKEVHAGTEPKSNVSLTFTGPAVYSQAEIDRFYMLVDVLNIRIIDVLREQMSLIYGGGMSGSFERKPYVHYSVNSFLPCAPENVDKVIAATFAEIEKLRNEGPQQADVDKVKQNWLENNRINMRTNGYWLRHLQDAILYGTDPAEFLHLEKRVDAISPTDLRDAAQHYFNVKNYVQVVLYPEK